MQAQADDLRPRRRDGRGRGLGRGLLLAFLPACDEAFLNDVLGGLVRGQLGIAGTEFADLGQRIGPRRDPVAGEVATDHDSRAAVSGRTVDERGAVAPVDLGVDCIEDHLHFLLRGSRTVLDCVARDFENQPAFFGELL